MPDFAAGIEDGIRGWRIGLLRRFHEQDFAADPEVVAAFEAMVAVLRGLGATLVEVTVPYAVQQYRDCMRPISSAEALSIHGPDMRTRFPLMGRALQEKFLGAMAISGAEYVTAQRWRRQMAEATDAAIAAATPC